MRDQISIGPFLKSYALALLILSLVSGILLIVMPPPLPDMTTLETSPPEQILIESERVVRQLVWQQWLGGWIVFLAAGMMIGLTLPRNQMIAGIGFTLFFNLLFCVAVISFNEPAGSFGWMLCGGMFISGTVGGVCGIQLGTKIKSWLHSRRNGS